MWWYLSEDERTSVTEIITAAGSAASASAPIAWLRLEPMEAIEPDLRLTLWPQGTDVRLARADAHGRHVRWSGVEP